MFTPEQKDRVVKLLQEFAKDDDRVRAHWAADMALLALIQEPEVEAAWDAIVKWNPRKAS
jgi:hypothetical protein